MVGLSSTFHLLSSTSSPRLSWDSSTVQCSLVEAGEHQVELTALYHAVVLQQMLKYLGPDIEKWWRCNDVRQ